MTDTEIIRTLRDALIYEIGSSREIWTPSARAAIAAADDRLSAPSGVEPVAWIGAAHLACVRAAAADLNGLEKELMARAALIEPDDVPLYAAPQPAPVARLSRRSMIEAFEARYHADWNDPALQQDVERWAAAWTDATLAATPKDAPAESSPTAGMSMAQRILHVGGRENAAGYVEFGSVQAVEALVRQVLRDLPAPTVAQPMPPEPQLKRVALVARHAHCWQTIERDLKDASANGLRGAAGGLERGWWREAAALDWARARGKLIEHACAAPGGVRPEAA